MVNKVHIAVALLPLVLLATGGCVMLTVSPTVYRETREAAPEPAPQPPAPVPRQPRPQPDEAPGSSPAEDDFWGAGGP
jgi:hypothetical protein